MTVIEVRFMEVVMSALPQIVKQLTRIADELAKKSNGEKEAE